MFKPQTSHSVCVCPETSKKLENCQYPVEEVLFLLLITRLCGCTNLATTLSFGKSQLKWLKKYYEFKNGLPSPEAILKLLAIIHPDDFPEIIASMFNLSPGSKTAWPLPSSACNNAKGYFSTTNLCHLSGSMAFRFPENLSSSALSGFFEAVNTKGMLVNFDCRQPADELLARGVKLTGGDYFVKLPAGLPEEPRNELKYIFKVTGTSKQDEFLQAVNSKIEKWRVSATTDLRLFSKKNDWMALQCLVKIERNGTRGRKGCDFYLTSLPAEDGQFFSCIKNLAATGGLLQRTVALSTLTGDWGFRKLTLEENLNIIDGTVAHILRNSACIEGPVYTNMLRAGMDTTFRARLLDNLNEPSRQPGKKAPALWAAMAS